MEKTVITIAEALEYQRSNYGRVVLGRDALYALARAHSELPIVRMGKRIFFPRSTIDGLVTGTIQIPSKT